MAAPAGSELFDQLADHRSQQPNARPMASRTASRISCKAACKPDRTRRHPVGTTAAARQFADRIAQVRLKQKLSAMRARRPPSTGWPSSNHARATPTRLRRSANFRRCIRNKRKLLRQLREDLRLQAGIELWLYIHVPLTAALLMALAAHILTVFLYW